jgi:hypothetical protein
MKRGMVLGGALVALLVVVVVAASLYLFANLDSIIKAAIEKVGSDVTGTEVALNDVEISLTDGRGSLLGFRMTNPAGFKTDEAFKFDEITILIDTASVASDPVIIKEVVILRPQITYEIGDKKTNLDAIQENTARYSEGSSASSDAGDSQAPKVIIENLHMRGGTVNVVASQFPDDKVTAGLPDVHLKDIGREGNGATPGEITQELMSEMLTRIGDAISRIDFSAMTEKLSGGAQEALSSLGAKSLESDIESLGQSIGEAAESAGEALEGLFNSGGN